MEDDVVGTGAVTGASSLSPTLGQAFSVSVDPSDTWLVCDTGNPDCVVTAAGTSDYGPFFDGGAFFDIGTSRTGFAGASGALNLFMWGRNTNNFEIITPTVAAIPLSAAAPAAPARLVAWGGLSHRRRRRATAA